MDVHEAYEVWKAERAENPRSNSHIIMADVHFLINVGAVKAKDVNTTDVCHNPLLGYRMTLQVRAVFKKHGIHHLDSKFGLHEDVVR